MDYSNFSYFSTPLSSSIDYPITTENEEYEEYEQQQQQQHQQEQQFINNMNFFLPSPPPYTNNEKEEEEQKNNLNCKYIENNIYCNYFKTISKLRQDLSYENSYESPYYLIHEYDHLLFVLKSNDKNNLPIHVTFYNKQFKKIINTINNKELSLLLKFDNNNKETHLLINLRQINMDSKLYNYFYSNIYYMKYNIDMYSKIVRTDSYENGNPFINLKIYGQINNSKIPSPTGFIFLK